MDFFKKNQRSLADQMAEANAQNFFEVSTRNESLPKHAMVLAHTLSVLAFLAGVYYLPVGAIWKGIAFLVGSIFMFQWERGRNQFLQDYHKGEVILKDKKPQSNILAIAEDLIDTSREAKVWCVIFTIGDLFVTMGMWLYTTYSDAVSMKTAAITAKGKVATQHLAAVSEAVKGGYGKSTMTAIETAAAKADAAITINYVPILVTMAVAAVAILMLQAFTYATASWYVSSVYQNQKKKFGQQTSNQQPTAQLPQQQPIRRAG